MQGSQNSANTFAVLGLGDTARTHLIIDDTNSQLVINRQLTQLFWHHNVIANWLSISQNKTYQRIVRNIYGLFSRINVTGPGSLIKDITVIRVPLYLDSLRVLRNALVEAASAKPIALTLMNCQLNDTLVELLFETQSPLALTKLDLSSNALTDIIINRVFISLSSFSPTLTTLDFSNNKITDKGAAALLGALANNLWLVSLNLTNNLILDQELLAKIAQQLADNESIAILKKCIKHYELDLKNVSINTDLMRQIQKMMACGVRIESIRFGDQSIPTSEYLEEMLYQNNHLKNLKDYTGKPTTKVDTLIHFNRKIAKIMGKQWQHRGFVLREFLVGMFCFGLPLIGIMSSLAPLNLLEQGVLLLSALSIAGVYACGRLFYFEEWEKELNNLKQLEAWDEQTRHEAICGRKCQTSLLALFDFKARTPAAYLGFYTKRAEHLLPIDVVPVLSDEPTVVVGQKPCK